MSSTACCDNESRRNLTAAVGSPNGIDFVNVSYEPANQIELQLFEAAGLQRGWLSIVDLADPDVHLAILWPEVPPPPQTRWTIPYAVTDAGPYEGHTYRLTLRDADGNPLPGFDPRLSSIDFIFNQTIGSEVDFQKPQASVESIFPAPDINYLAKDYASFRRLLLDRMSLTVPGWQETHAADVGMAVLEVLAYAGDRLSYQQDAIATEGYLGTARQRQSVRRHARLVDYQLHEGCNAKAFLHLQVEEGAGELKPLPAEDVFFTTAIPVTWQIPGKIHQLGQLPPELYQDILCYEPVMLSRGDWRITLEDIKDTRFVQLADAIPLWLSMGAQAAIPLLRTKQDDTPHVAVTTAKLTDKIEELNKLIENRELRKPEADPRTQTLPLRFRNRALFDEVLGDFFSSAQLDNQLRLSSHLNSINLYTWGEERCSLPLGSTSATLKDEVIDPATSRRKLSSLNVGDFLLLEEVRGPRTGAPADADPHHRQVVRLTKVLFTTDPLNGQPLVEVDWSEQDQLKFPLCILSQAQPANGCGVVNDVSVARGNIVLVDHGRRLPYESIGTRTAQIEQVDCGDRWNDISYAEIGDRFEPVLRDTNLTYAHVINQAAARQSQSQPTAAQPAIQLLGIPGIDRQGLAATINLVPSDLELSPAGFKNKWRSLLAAERHVLEDQLAASAASELNDLTRNELPDDKIRELIRHLRTALTWEPRFDLLQSKPTDRHFVVENNNERTAHLRFGDGKYGRLPVAGTTFYATYRTGNGAAGNVGADSIVQAVFRRNFEPALVSVTNPLPAAGGQDPESLREGVLHAPQVWQVDQPRAVRPEDYERLVRKEFKSQIQNVKASVNWVGAYYAVEVVIDRLAGATAAPNLVSEVAAFLNQRRRIAHIVSVVDGQKVPLALGLTIWLKTGYRAEDVRAELMGRFSNRRLTNGQFGFFHPDRLTFGQKVIGSEVVSEARGVRGVHDVRIDFLQRYEPDEAISTTTTPGPCPQAAGAWRNFEVAIGDLQIAQLDNDGNVAGGSRANGFLCLNMGGQR